MKKFMSVLLSVCMIMMYTVPAFAYTSDAVSKTAISDQEMAGAVGGSGGLDAEIAAYSASTGGVEAVIANRSASTANYALKLVNASSGALVQTLASGGISNLGQAKVVSAVVAPQYLNMNYCVRIELTSNGIPGHNCSDAAHAY